MAAQQAPPPRHPTEQPGTAPWLLLLALRGLYTAVHPAVHLLYTDPAVHLPYTDRQSPAVRQSVHRQTDTCRTSIRVLPEQTPTDCCLPCTTGADTDRLTPAVRQSVHWPYDNRHRTPTVRQPTDTPPYTVTGPNNTDGPTTVHQSVHRRTNDCTTRGTPTVPNDYRQLTRGTPTYSRLTWTFLPYNVRGTLPSVQLCMHATVPYSVVDRRLFHA